MRRFDSVPARELRDGDLVLLPWARVLTIDGVSEDLVASCNDPAMVRWTTVPHPYTGEHAEEFLGPTPPGEIRWAYVVDGRYCGNIALRVAEEQAAGELGYCTAPWGRGRGLTTRAVRLVTDHAFAHGMRKLVIRAGVDNAPSRRVAETAGYALTDIAPSEVAIRGITDDLARYVALHPST